MRILPYSRTQPRPSPWMGLGRCELGLTLRREGLPAARGSDASRTGQKEVLYLGAGPDRRRPPQRRGVSGRLSAGGREFVMVTGQSVGRRPRSPSVGGRAARKDFRRRQVIVQHGVIIERLFSQASGPRSRKAVVRVPLQHTASSLVPSATESRAETLVLRRY